MEELNNKEDIILCLDKMHKNMVADGTRVNTNEKDTKVVALTTQLGDAKKRIADARKG